MFAVRRVLLVLFVALLSAVSLGAMRGAAETDAYPTAISDAATYVPPTTDTVSGDDESFPTEISDPATYIPPTADAVGGETDAYPTEISDPATYVSETPDTAGDSGTVYPTEISDPATYVPEATATEDAVGAVGSVGSGQQGDGSTNQALAQELPNTGSGPAQSGGALPWLLFLAFAAFVGTMVIRVRRATHSA